MVKFSIKKLKKYYGPRLLLDIQELQVYKGDRIGVVGMNGAGKTTLLEIINKDISYDSGDLFIHKDTTIKYVSQLKEPNRKKINGKYASIFQVPDTWTDSMSGGEKTRFKLAEGFENKGSLMLVDEPTSNLDIEGIELITKNFKEYSDTFMVVSHDRNFLDNVCNKILEIENRKVKLYNGNYSKYVELKEEEMARKEFEYEQYAKEKKRLTNLKGNIKEQSSQVRTTPKRMGNSEARLHKMGGQVNKEKLDSFAKSVESRMNHLEKKEKPIENNTVKIEISDSSKPHSRVLVSGDKIDKAYGKNIIFKNTKFNIYNGKKVALIGPNGSGKTTLIKMILNKENINISKNVKIGYFSQSMDVLDGDKTILENVMENSIHDETFVRIVLARLLISGDKVYEKLEILSGGERVKVSFAKMILTDINFLILDEPTNYLDISSLEVIEDLLINYTGTVLLVSHDSKFIENIAEELLIIENNKIKKFEGTYKEYLRNKSKTELNKKEKEIREQIMILKMQISSLLSQISVEENEQNKGQLNKEYKLKLKELTSLNKNI